MVTFFRSMSSRGLFVLAVSALAGAPLTALGVYQLYRTSHEISTGVRVQGIVLRTELTDGGYYPLIRFEAAGQGIMRFTDRSGSHKQEFQEGEQVVVLYPPYEPEKARVFTPQRFWFAPVVMTSAGLLPLLLGALTAWFTERKKREGEE
jgi:hypothetical protein